MRMAGNDVLMVSGTDEHGTPIPVQAENEGVTAARAGRHVQPGDRATTCRASGCPTTCSPAPPPRNHYAVTQEMFPALLPQRLHRAPRPRWRRSAPSTGRTLPDRYIEGTCPICGYTGARGDQCDNCGNQLDPIDLINPRSQINGETPDSSKPSTSSWTCRPSAERCGSGWRPGATGAPTCCKFSLDLLDDLQAHEPSPATSTGASRSRWTAGGTSRQADLRVVRRRHRLPVRSDRVGAYASSATPTPGRSGGWTPRRRPTTSWARTTSSSTR